MEVIATAINNSKSAIKFLKRNIFTRLGRRRTLLNDNETHFCNKPLDCLLKKDKILHKVTKPYHPKISDQVYLFNSKLKNIQEKTVD